MPAKAMEVDARPRKPSAARFDHVLEVIRAKDWEIEKLVLGDATMSEAR